jgi:hypothetical protein
MKYGNEERRETEENKQRKWEINEHIDTRRTTNKKLKRTIESKGAEIKEKKNIKKE